MIHYLTLLGAASNVYQVLPVLVTPLCVALYYLGLRITSRSRRGTVTAPAHYMRIARLQGMIQAATCVCTCGNPDHVLDILGELEKNAVKRENFAMAADLRDAAAYYRKEVLSKIR